MGGNLFSLRLLSIASSMVPPRDTGLLSLVGVTIGVLSEPLLGLGASLLAPA